MIQRIVLTLWALMLLVCSYAQQQPDVSCGQKGVTEQLFKTNAAARDLHQQIETQLRQYNLRVKQGQEKAQRVQAVVTLPVVVHIIHNNGTENISDAQVLTAIQHLNEAFANTGFYDPADGVNTNIQFCLAQRDPNNNPTNGITRDVSSYTNMGGVSYYSEDQLVKNINRWNPNCYINIWVVRSIPGSVAGYAYLPSAHGSALDGIIVEAGYFGSSYSNDVVIVHEMGHYLGLYHTFEGACTNNDCTSDGDKVCDTPPDQSTAGTACNVSMNSCSTDALSGFSADMNDLTQDYMDYGNFNCMKVFTQGQADRMNWHIQHVRSSLLACKSCMTPCPAPVTADFTTPPGVINAGAAYTFTNTSVNAASYEWHVNGVLQATTANYTYSFPAIGIHTIRLVAHSSNGLCVDAEKKIFVQAVCPVTAGFTKSASAAPTGSTISFTNTSTNADGYQWKVNGAVQSSVTNYSYTSNTAGKYVIELTARNTALNCQQTFTDTIELTCAVTASFTPLATTTLPGTPITFTSTSTGATTWQWEIEGSNAGSGPSLVYAFINDGVFPVKLTVSNGICTSVATSYVVVGNQCNNPVTLYQKNYPQGLNSGLYDIQPTPDGGAIIAARILQDGTHWEAALMKLDAGGNVVFARTYSDKISARFLKVKPASDGGYIAIGDSRNNNSPITSRDSVYIVKTDATGIIQWSRNYTFAEQSSGYDILQSPDGHYYFTGQFQAVTGVNQADLVIGKLDGSGTLIWLKGYDAVDVDQGVSIAEHNNHLVIAGNISRRPNYIQEGLLMKVQKTDGAVAWYKTFLSGLENFRSVQVGTDGYYIDNIRQPTVGAGFMDHVVLKTDFDGNLRMSVYHRPFPFLYESGLILKPNGHMIVNSSFGFGASGQDVLLAELDATGATVWAKNYNKPNAWISAISKAGNDGIHLAGSTSISTAPNTRIYVMRLDSAGNTGGCPTLPASVQYTATSYTTTPYPCQVRDLQTAIKTNHQGLLYPIGTNVECQITKCDSVSVDTCGIPCVTNGISGSDSVCNRANTFTYELLRNSDCPSKAVWTFDPAFIDTLSTTDSSVILRFKQKGITVLRSTITTRCKTLSDSITISVFDSPVSLNLGPDLTLCKISTHTLRAGSGFAAYRWQDGSADSSFTLNDPGTYFVEAMDHCGNYYRDTVVVTLSPDIPFDLGADKVVCRNDTVTITAPAGFTKYYWTPDYSINNRYSANIKVVAAKDTTYTVTAEQGPGCLVMDTIHIKVNIPLPVNLGKDTSICRFDTITLQAPAGFTNYTWNTGAHTQTIRAAIKAKYIVTATDANNCSSRDTVEITNVFDPPANFLTDTAICPMEQLEIKAPAGFASYRWFNNSTIGSVTVSAPGNYWLQVTDARGCEGFDTVHVLPKVCGKGVYFPNAFSPGNDATNNVFRPVVRGALEQYQLMIFNRWGEKVYETKDAIKGWDGFHKNTLQNTGTFVWMCRYKLIGEPAQLLRGTVTLVRYK